MRSGCANRSSHAFLGDTSRARDTPPGHTRAGPQEWSQLFRIRVQTRVPRADECDKRESAATELLQGMMGNRREAHAAARWRLISSPLKLECATTRRVSHGNYLEAQERCGTRVSRTMSENVYPPSHLIQREGRSKALLIFEMKQHSNFNT